MLSLINKDCIIKKIPETNIIVVDNLFVDYVVDVLRHRMQTGNKFHDIYDGYAAIDYLYDNDKLTQDISIEIQKKFNLKNFKRAWSFIYNNNGKVSSCFMQTLQT